MSAQIRPTSGSFVSPAHHNISEVASPSPLRHSTASSHSPTYTPDRYSNNCNCSSTNDLSSISERLNNVDFNSPAKIFQRKHAIHQFENVTPDISGRGSPSAITSAKFNYDSDVTSESEARDHHLHTPRSLSPENLNHKQDCNKSNNTSKKQHSPPSDYDSEDGSVSQRGSSSTSLTNTPSQFVFKKPEYNSHYHHTHFHHLEKKDTVFHDLKRFFKKNQDKKKKKHLLDDSSVRSSGSSVYSRQSDLSFANEFNKDLEARYGKWGKD